MPEKSSTFCVQCIDIGSRDFTAKKPFEKCVTDITEIPARDGKLYVSAIFDCYDMGVLGLAMRDNMKADLCVSTATVVASISVCFTGQSLAAVEWYRA